MSEQSTYYTLKPGYEKALEDYKTGHGDTDVFLFELEKLIQPLDIETIRQQIDSAIEHAIVRTLNDFAEQTGYEQDMTYQSQVIKDARDAVLAVVGITKETEQ